MPGRDAPGAVGARGSIPPDTAPATPDAVAAAAEARAVVVPAGAGAPQPPDVPLPVRGGTATRAERILPPPPGPLPAGCITKYIRNSAEVEQDVSGRRWISCSKKCS
jgi:hypothetical protein